jgi:hypothetical protein
MTVLTMYRKRIDRVRRASRVRPPGARVGRSVAASAVLRPLVVTVGVLTAGATAPAAGHADPPNGSVTGSLTGIGQSICPMLVKPGATLASVMSQFSGKSGLPPGMAGMVAGMAIQMECPSMMASVANGKMPFPLPGVGGGGGLPMPGGLPIPGMLPVANPGPAVPFSLPGVGPAAAPPFGFPGH